MRPRARLRATLYEVCAMLPIFAIQDDIRDALTHSPLRPLVIGAPTGSGKSTQLPGWLHEMTGRPVLAVQPRRVACRALATYLSKLDGQPVGQRIGYRVRFEDKSSPKTKILFVTPGVALRMLQAPDFDMAVMLDEFHERGWETDLLATLLLERFEQEAFPFVLTSATLQIDDICAHVKGRALEAQGRSFPVDIEYMPQGQFQPSKQGLTERVSKAVHRILGEDPDGGDVLVFLPGKGEIRSVRDALGKVPRVHALHSGVQLGTLTSLLDASGTGARKVFLATNIAETSLTVPGVTWVVDSGLVRMSIHRAGHTALTLVPASESSMDQRAGRAGRVQAGRCVRLWDEHWAPTASTPPEIERMELEEVVLRAAACGLAPTCFEQAPWITAPPSFAVSQALEHLEHVGAIKAGSLTETGRRLGRLPVSVQQARMLIDTPKHLHSAVADLVAIVQRGQRMILPLDGQDGARAAEVKQRRQALFEGCSNEVMIALRALRAGDARAHGLHDASLRETRKIALALRQTLDPNLPAPHKRPDEVVPWDDLVGHLLRRTPEAAFVKRERALKRAGRGNGAPWTNGSIEVVVSEFSPPNPSDRPQQPPKAGVLLDHIWLGDALGQGAHARGSLLLPCTYKDLARAEVGEQSVSEHQIEKPSRRIVGQIERTLGNVVLERQVRPLRGAPLCQAVAHFVLQGRLFKGTRDDILDAYHLWSILKGWAPTLETQHWDLDALQALDVPEVEADLAKRLQELGVHTQDDLALVEGEDLLPDLEALSGLHRMELDALLQDFPRQWSHLGAVYDCTVNPKARRVTIRPANKSTKKVKEPQAKHLPRFQGFRVVYKQASRSLVLRG